MSVIWKIGLVVSFNTVRELHLHDAYPVNYQDRKIDHMQFWPLLPDSSYVSSNSQPYNEKHACGGAGSRREDMWNDYLQMESLTCWGMWSIKSYSISVATMTWKGFSCCFENDRDTAYLGCNVHLIGSSGQKRILLVSPRTDQPLEWNMQEGSILYETRWPWFDYISTGVVRQIFYSAVPRPYNLIKVKHSHSNITDHSLDETWC